MILEKLIQSAQIDEEKGYWFVRTDSGENFDSFYENDFIGIGWNEITVTDLKNLSTEQLKAKIANIDKLDPKNPTDKGNITGILNKINRFSDLLKGDVILIPSRGSQYYAFGIIEDDAIYTVNSGEKACSYTKRRKVKWLDKSNVDLLDPIFYKIKVSRHTISDIKQYQNYIDNVTNNVYIKDGFGHYVLDIETLDAINVDSLVGLISSLKNILQNVNDAFDLGEDTDELSIRLNLQSPGKIEFKLNKGKSLIILAAIIGTLTGCEPPGDLVTTNDKKQKEGFIETNKTLFNKTTKQLNALKVKKEEMKNLN